MTVAERELREKKAKLWNGCQAIMDKMQQGVELSAADREEFDTRNKKISEIDKDLERIAQFGRMDEAKREATDSRGELPPATPSDKMYEQAFLHFLRDGHTDNMSSEERSCFRAYSTPQILNYPASDQRYQQYVDTHGTAREIGYKGLRTADIPWSSEIRAVLDANALTTAPNSAGVAAGATGYDAGYLIPQGFWHNLQIALKAYGGMLPYLQMLSTDSGQPMPWPTVDPTAIVGRYITEQNQLGFGGDSNGTDYQFGQGI
jgi:HK97 family phage major capsid protein